MNQSQFHYELENKDSFWEFNYLNEIVKNPKFASDFFLSYVSRL